MVAEPTMAAPETLMALPVGPGKPGQGPWTIEVWPYAGCKTCPFDQAAAQSFIQVVADLLAAPGSAMTYPNIVASKVREGASYGSRIKLEQLRSELRGCKAGAKGVLAPNSVTRAVAFGVRFDCDNRDKPGWMSVVMSRDNKPSAIYWLPDRPIYVAGTR
jgi:hypothetical protein